MNLLRHFQILVGALIFLGLPPMSAWSEEPMEAVAAVVNDAVISTYDVRQRMMLLAISSGIQPSPEVLGRLQSEALKDLVNEKLQTQEAKEFEIAIPAEEVDHALSNLASRTGATADELASELAQSGISVNSLREQIEAQIMWQRLVSGMFSRKIRVGENEIEATMDRIVSSASKSSYQISEIFLQTASVEEQQQGVQVGMRLIEEMKKGAPFQAIAQQFSSAASAARGGNRGWVLSGELEPEIEQVVATMQPGQVSMPIPTEDGIYIVALMNKKEGEDVTPSLHLKQVSYNLAEMSQDEAEKKLLEIKSEITNCDGFDELLVPYEGVNNADLGSIQQDQLTDDLIEVLSPMRVNSTTPPMPAGDQLAILVLCDRSFSGSDSIPSREEVENRLIDQQLAMQSERYLRDLRSEATIIIR